MATAQIAFVSGVSGAYFVNDSVRQDQHVLKHGSRPNSETANDNVSHDGSFNLVVFC